MGAPANVMAFFDECASSKNSRTSFRHLLFSSTKWLSASPSWCTTALTWAKLEPTAAPTLDDEARFRGSAIVFPITDADRCDLDSAPSGPDGLVGVVGSSPMSPLLAVPPLSSASAAPPDPLLSGTPFAPLPSPPHPLFRPAASVPLASSPRPTSRSVTWASALPLAGLNRSVVNSSAMEGGWGGPRERRWAGRGVRGSETREAAARERVEWWLMQARRSHPPGQAGRRARCTLQRSRQASEAGRHGTAGCGRACTSWPVGTGRGSRVLGGRSGGSGRAAGAIGAGPGSSGGALLTCIRRHGLALRLIADTRIDLCVRQCSGLGSGAQHRLLPGYPRPLPPAQPPPPPPPVMSQCPPPPGLSDSTGRVYPCFFGAPGLGLRLPWPPAPRPSVVPPHALLAVCRVGPRRSSAVPTRGSPWRRWGGGAGGSTRHQHS